MHVLTRPLSEYLRFESSRYYAPHVLAGKDIRILDVTERENPLPDVEDFWMFDRSTVVLTGDEPGPAVRNSSGALLMQDAVSSTFAW